MENQKNVSEISDQDLEQVTGGMTNPYKNTPKELPTTEYTTKMQNPTMCTNFKK